MGPRDRMIPLALLLVAGVMTFPGPLLAGPPPGGVEGIHGAIPGFPVNSCYVCHDIPPGTTGPDAVQRPNLTCFGCHTDGPTFGEGDPWIDDRPHATPVGNHASLVTGSIRFTYGEFGLSWPYPGYQEQIDCTTCHDPHRTFDPADPSPSTTNTKYIRDHTDDYQVISGQVTLFPSKTLKVVDNTGPTPVTVTKVVDQDIVYTGPADLADGVGMSAAEADVCEVCHTLTDHHQVDDTAPGGQSHFDGEDCTSCHTHPTGFAPSGGQPLTGPHAAFGDPDCASCHGSEFFPGAVNNPTGQFSVFCQTCHGPTDPTYSEIHSHLVTGSGKFEYTIDCGACHDQHGWAINNVDGNDNLAYLKATIDETIFVVDNTSGGVPITKTITSDIVFDSRDDFADGDALYDRDVCVTCHTLTSHHQNDGTAPGGQSHYDGQDCATCHQHAEGFRTPGGLGGPPLQGPHAAIPGSSPQDCFACHGQPTFPGEPGNPGGEPSVFCATCHSPDTVAQVHSHTVTGTARFEYTMECLACHDQHGWDITNVDGNDNLSYIKATIDEQITVVDLTQVPPVQVDKTITSDIVFDSQDDFANGDGLYDRDVCVTCHTLTNHHQNDGTAPGGQSHRDGEVCTTCHQHPEGFRPPGGLAGPPVEGPHAAIPGFAGGDCLVCHSLFPTTDEMKANSTEVCLSCHSDTWSIVSATPEHLHSSVITGSTRFDYNVECAACHAPHGWSAEIDNVQGTQNIKYVRANIDEMITVVDNTVDPPATVTKQVDNNVVFTATTGDGSFADGDGNFTEDVCNTCHTLTNHHQSDGTAPGGQSHFDGQECTQCHLHPEGFGGFGGPHPQAVTDCSNCHLNADGDPDIQQLHGNECELCHTVSIPDTFLGPLGTWNQECTDCHNPLIAETGFMDEPTKGHRCVACHGNQLSTGDINDIHEEHAEKANCVVCHGFIPDVGTEIGSGNRQICVTCHGSPRSGTSIRKIHEKHTDKGLSCLECHGGVRPPVDVVDGPLVGGAENVCDICHSNRDPADFDEGDHKKHTDRRLDCGSCHRDANLQDDRVPMPEIDDSVRGSLNRSGFNECRHCHPGGESGSSEEVHEEHVADQWQWCYNCHPPGDGRPAGDQPPVTQPAQACRLCHGFGESYNDAFPFDIHEEHAGKGKCYACHQTQPQLFDWPASWLGGTEPGPGGGGDSVTVRDEFNAVSFANDDGPDSWAGPWLEDDPQSGGSGPTAGQVRVVSGALRLDDRPDTGGQPSAARTVDLSGGPTSATFSFDWSTARGVDRSDEVTVEVSSNGGASYSTLQRITGVRGSRSGSESHDITPWISASTTIRFRVSRNYGSSSEYFYADNVEIDAQ